MNLLIFPNTLFKIKYYPNINFNEIYICECNQYFIKYKYNTKKILLHRASMKFYYDYISSNFPQKKITYIESNKYNDFVSRNPKKHFYYFDTIENIPELINLNVTIIESPNFLLNKKICYNVYLKISNFIFIDFCNCSLKYLNKNKNNKLWKKLKNKVIKLNNIKLNNIKLNNVMDDLYYIKEATEYIDNFTKLNKLYGDVNNFNIPITFDSADKLLKLNLKKINNESLDNYTIYTNLLPLINIGFIHPTEIMDALIKIDNQQKNINKLMKNLLRREFYRYCYIYKKKWMLDINFNPISSKLPINWYKGNLNISPVDNTIKKAFKTGCINDIQKQLVIGNFMILNNIISNNIFQWFMEFPTDSYEWITYKYIYDLLFFNIHNKTVDKSYVVSSSYIKYLTKCDLDGWEKKCDILFAKYNKDNDLWDFKDYIPRSP